MREEKVILTNMCMVHNNDKILVQMRKKDDWSGIAFPGGHIEEGESVVLSVIREVFEETGLTIKNPKMCGIKQFFTRADNYRYIVFLFKTDTYEGDLRASDEGEIFWINKSELDKYQLAVSFREMLEVFESDDFCELFSKRDKDGKPFYSFY